ncbi:MAG: hypothetical protein K0U24_04155 [Gammaproteobacteria bacterium]|nr:hypothetical protein [Gammaproteobacteria bacterium]MCH9763407.1 hypothetical protein [Gammaproteobacteria bacterium]
MKKIIALCSSLLLSLTSSFALAVPPKILITHNQTNLESNAFVAATIPSQHPTKAYSEGRVIWASVRMACFGHLTNGKCPALIKLATDTDNPIELGIVTIDLSNGDIQPKTLHANGYSMIVNGPAETTLYEGE